MTRSEIEKELEKMIQKLFFDEKNLIVLKTAVDKVHKGQLTPQELRKLIVEFRILVVKKVLELFPYYSNQVKTLSERVTPSAHHDPGGSSGHDNPAPLHSWYWHTHAGPL